MDKAIFIISSVIGIWLLLQLCRLRSTNNSEGVASNEHEDKTKHLTVKEIDFFNNMLKLAKDAPMKYRTSVDPEYGYCEIREVDHNYIGLEFESNGRFVWAVPFTNIERRAFDSTFAWLTKKEDQTTLNAFIWYAPKRVLGGVKSRIGSELVVERPRTEINLRLFCAKVDEETTLLSICVGDHGRDIAIHKTSDGFYFGYLTSLYTDLERVTYISPKDANDIVVITCKEASEGRICCISDEAFKKALVVFEKAEKENHPRTPWDLDHDDC